ncbi:MAG: thiol-disulfide oxidoreductase [Nitrospirales bacterium]|nr:MAG: thiol-disulfide oxidoreductase [Nitrospirales bacterium]
MSNRRLRDCSHTPATAVVHENGEHVLRKHPPYPLTVYYDGDCPICRREISLIKMLNRKERLQFVDFSKSSYDEADHGLSSCNLARVIHARWSDGTIIHGVDVFRETWEAIGLGILARLSRQSIINQWLVRAYAWFAKNRLRLTGRT